MLKVVRTLPAVPQAPHQLQVRWIQKNFNDKGDGWAIDAVRIFANFEPSEMGDTLCKGFQLKPANSMQHG